MFKSHMATYEIVNFAMTGIKSVFAQANEIHYQ